MGTLDEHGKERPGADWYFFFMASDDGDDPARPGVGIVHKGFWHRTHTLDDRHIRHRLTLPKGMGEAQESVFDYRFSPGAAEQELIALGYQKLDTPYWWYEAKIVHLCRIGGKRFRFDIVCDTPDLRQVLTASIPSGKQGLRSFPDLDAYRVWIESLTSDIVCSISDDYGTGAAVCVMKKEVAASLPTYSEDPDDDED